MIPPEKRQNSSPSTVLFRAVASISVEEQQSNQCFVIWLKQILLPSSCLERFDCLQNTWDLLCILLMTILQASGPSIFYILLMNPEEASGEAVLVALPCCCCMWVFACWAVCSRLCCLVCSAHCSSPQEQTWNQPRLSGIRYTTC